MTHIAVSCGRLALGGPETHLRYLCGLLCANGAKVTIYGTGCDWGKETLECLRKSGVRLLVPPRCLDSFRSIAKIVAVLLWIVRRDRTCDYLLLIGAGNSHKYLQRLTRPRAGTVYHELVMPPHIQTTGSLAYRCMEISTVLVANSSNVALAMAPFSSGKVLITLPFLTASKPAVVARHRGARRDQILHFGYLGRLDQRKRPDVLVKNWRMLAQSAHVGPAILHVYGTDQGNGMAADLRDWVQSNRAEDEIRLHGAYCIEELDRILANLDAVLLPSEWEGLPLVLVEAMQHGVPFVATHAGGTAELGIGNPDVIVTHLAWDAFAEAVSEMSRKLRFGEIDSLRLQRWSEQRYGYKPVAERWLRLFGLNAQEATN